MIEAEPCSFSALMEEGEPFSKFIVFKSATTMDNEA
jgi:hypothetical protein